MAMKVRYTVVDGEVISENRNGVSRFYVPDSLGSMRALLDNTQAQTDTFTYWPYGEEQSRTGTTPTPFRFVGSQGYYRDSSSRTYVRARCLELTKGRWLTKDPLGFAAGDVNLYRYVGSNPINSIDPTGMFCWPDFWKCLKKAGIAGIFTGCWAGLGFWCRACIISGLVICSGGGGVAGFIPCACEVIAGCAVFGCATACLKGALCGFGGAILACIKVANHDCKGPNQGANSPISITSSSGSSCATCCPSGNTTSPTL